MPPVTTRQLAAVERARARRASTAARNVARIESFVTQVTATIEMTMRQRVLIATNLVKNKVVKNISISVDRIGSVVVGRSKPGEFPRADTTQLMKTIFSDVVPVMGGYFGYIATPLDYGLKLEIEMNRSFLVRTLREESGKIRAILTGPMKGYGPVSSFSLR